MISKASMNKEFQHIFLGKKKRSINVLQKEMVPRKHEATEGGMTAETKSILLQGT